MFFKICVLKGFVKFIGKHLYQSSSFNKVEGLRPTTLLKKRHWDRCFPVNFAKMNTFCLRTPLVTASVQLLPIILRLLGNSKTFPIGFYYLFQNSCYT